jgi:hypothetical protein
VYSAGAWSQLKGRRGPRDADATAKGAGGDADSASAHRQGARDANPISPTPGKGNRTSRMHARAPTHTHTPRLTERHRHVRVHTHTHTHMHTCARDTAPVHSEDATRAGTDGFANGYMDTGNKNNSFTDMRMDTGTGVSGATSPTTSSKPSKKDYVEYVDVEFPAAGMSDEEEVDAQEGGGGGGGRSQIAKGGEEGAGKSMQKVSGLRVDVDFGGREGRTETKPKVQRVCVNLASLLRRWCLAIDSGIGLQACVVASPSVPWPHAQCAACVFVCVRKQQEKKPSYTRGAEGGRRQHPKAKAPAKLKSKALAKLASPALTAKR